MGNLKSFSEFLEAAVKEITITFGRFNPPTTGHGILLDKVASVAGKNAYRIYASHSNDTKKNPLKYDEKIKFLRKMFPKYARSIIDDENAKTIFNILAIIHKEGFTKLNLVVGSDRVDEFKTLLNRYAGTTLKDGTTYDFKDGLNILSAGERDADSDGADGMSASKMRAAVSANNFKEFSKGLPIGFTEGAALFNILLKRLHLEEAAEKRKHIQLPMVSEVRESYLRGEIFNVGDFCRLKSGDVIRITKRGTNFVVTEDLKKRWLQDVQPIQEGWATNAYKKAGGKGLLYIDKSDEQSELIKPSEIKMALANIDKLDAKYADSFKVFKNLNGAVAFKEIAYVPFFHLI